MLCASFLSFAMLSLAALPACLADMSLALPGPHPPFSVDIVGVGADGETTYLLFPGQPTGTSWFDQQPEFTGAVTLVEDASKAEWDIVYNTSPYMTEVNSCAFSSSMANCVYEIAGEMTLSAEWSVMPVLVHSGGTASPAPTGSGSSAVPVQTTAAPGSSVPESAAVTQSAASPSITSSKSASSGVRLTPVKVAGLGGMLAIWAVLT